MKNRDIRVPFLKSTNTPYISAFKMGEEPEYVENISYSNGKPVTSREYLDWKDNDEIKLTLSISYLGKSASNMFISFDLAGIYYASMKREEFYDFFSKATITKGVVSGRWCFKKSGGTYSLVYLGD